MNFHHIVVLTGAGISAESGIQTFRGADGLWEGYKIEEVATPIGFARNPKLVHDFYNLRRKQLFEVEPNAAHFALAEFEKDFAGSFTLISQNVDDLHQRAGSVNLLSMHGQLRAVRCEKSDEVFYWKDDLSIDSKNPKTNEIGNLRPHIVWFGEYPLYMNEIDIALKSSDLFITIGTSGNVYPAAGFVQMVKPHCKKVLINLDEPNNLQGFDEFIKGKASEVLPNYLKNLNEK